MSGFILRFSAETDGMSQATRAKNPLLRVASPRKPALSSTKAVNNLLSPGLFRETMVTTGKPSMQQIVALAGGLGV